MKRIISFVIIAVLLLSISALTKNIWDSYKRLAGLSEIRREEQALREETEAFKKELAERKTKGFIEKEARDTLGLSKKGETIYLVEQEEEETVEQKNEKDVPNWQLWLSLFTN